MSWSNKRFIGTHEMWCEGNAYNFQYINKLVCAYAYKNIATHCYLRIE